MVKQTIDLSAQQAILSASLGVINNLWTQRFAQHKKCYDTAFTSISDRLTKAGKTQDKTVISMVAKIADMAVKPFGVYGMIASVALAGLSELAKSAVTGGDAVKLNAPSAATFAADLEGAAAKMFEPLTRKNLEIALLANKQHTMDADEFKSARSLLLSSPIWFPPPQFQDGLVTRRIEEVLWCAYFSGLYQAGYESYQLRFLDSIVRYLMDEALVSPRESEGWEDYPTPVSQGGPGDWLEFVRKTNRLWNYKLDDYVEKGWLTPMPVIPDNARIQTSVNWTPPKKQTFVAPTRSGKATIIIESVQMTLMPSLDWSDIPALQKPK